MKIIVARTAGFCMGVRRAVDMVFEAAESGPAGLVTIGPLIHNRHVVEMLERKGVHVIEDVGSRAVPYLSGLLRMESDAAFRDQAQGMIVDLLQDLLTGAG